ncbi:hypothetical protein NAT51_15395 [Flavobacterium amniphilum]|uniref:hypothetical protein n=1 Tax=Flavobacterium amniphilum TaxID=1834035 RepID=UPI00202AAA4F|nr:hypothetical protein [Flavobacterium amniphilum]MCL9806920.1 hypothetical protein [Flavobacterium amniphilum]
MLIAVSFLGWQLPQEFDMITFKVDKSLKPQKACVFYETDEPKEYLFNKEGELYFKKEATPKLIVFYFKRGKFLTVDGIEQKYVFRKVSVEKVKHKRGECFVHLYYSTGNHTTMAAASFMKIEKQRKK